MRFQIKGGPGLVINKFLLFFALFYFFVWILVGVYPVTSVTRSYVFLSLINSIFFAFVFVFAFLVSRIKIKGNSDRGFFTKKQTKALRRSIITVCLSSIVGLAFIAYDRMVIRGINYLDGIRAARYQWLNTEGGSAFSVLGNLLVPLSYAGLCLLVANRSFFNRPPYVLYFCIFLGVNVGHAALNGGRSNILLALVIIAIGLCLRDEPFRLRKLCKGGFGSILLIIPLFWYVSVIIESSANLGGVDITILLSRAIPKLHGDLSSVDVSELSNIEASFIYVTSYLVHGQWTAQSLVDISQFDGQHLIHPLYVFLEGQGIMSVDYEKSSFSKDGNFLSLPAAIYHDVGYLGLVVISSVIGVFWGFGLLLLRNRSKITGTKLGFLVLFSFMAFMAPIAPAHGFAYLKFVVYSFVMFGILNRLLYGRGYRII